MVLLTLTLQLLMCIKIRNIRVKNILHKISISLHVLQIETWVALATIRYLSQILEIFFFYAILLLSHHINIELILEWSKHSSRADNGEI